MSKQTIEEAAEKEALNHGKGFYSQAVIDDLEAFFIKGAAWQREQGIDWIPITESLPDMKKKNFLPILITNDKEVKIWYMLFPGFLPTDSFKTTHWSYINLPQNTEK